MDDKTALMIVGSLRNYKKTVNELLENLIKPNNCDVFLVISINNFSETLRTVDSESSIDDVKEYINTLSPYVKNYKILEEIIDYKENVNKLFETNYNGYNLKKIKYPKDEFKKNIEMCYLNYLCWELLQDYDYKIVARTRPDLLIKKEILLNCVEQNTFHYDRKSDFRDHPEAVYCSDYLCYGYKNVMEVFAKAVLTFGLTKRNYIDRMGYNLSLSKEYQLALVISKKKIKLRPEMLSKKGEHMSDTYALVIIR